MTYSNTGFSAHPLANPFNCRQQGNFNAVGFGLGRKSSVRLDSNAKLPDPKMPGEGEWIARPSSELEVPNQLGPELDGARLDTVGLAQQHPRLFTCLDGTMIDVKSQKVVYDPSKNAPPGHWNKCRDITSQSAAQTLGYGTWDDSEINQLHSAHQSSDEVGVMSDASSAKYWQQQAASQKPMTPEQEKLLAELEVGKLMKLSRLEAVDESCK